MWKKNHLVIDLFIFFAQSLNQKMEKGFLNQILFFYFFQILFYAEAYGLKTGHGA